MRSAAEAIAEPISSNAAGHSRSLSCVRCNQPMTVGTPGMCASDAGAAISSRNGTTAPMLTSSAAAPTSVKANTARNCSRRRAEKMRKSRQAAIVGNLRSGRQDQRQDGTTNRGAARIMVAAT